MRILVDSNSLQVSRYGTVTGLVHVQLGDFAFPEERWSDLVLALLRGWLEEIQDASTDPHREITLRFFDGPFEVRLHPTGAGVVRIAALSHGRTDPNMVETGILLEDLYDECHKAAVVVLAECDKRGWTPRDSKELAALTNRG